MSEKKKKAEKGENPLLAKMKEVLGKAGNSAELKALADEMATKVSKKTGVGEPFLVAVGDAVTWLARMHVPSEVASTLALALASSLAAPAIKDDESREAFQKLTIKYSHALGTAINVGHAMQHMQDEGDDDDNDRLRTLLGGGAYIHPPSDGGGRGH